MMNYLQHITLLIKRLLILYAFYTLSRLFFLILNLNYFEGLKLTEILKIFFFGLRFDTSVIMYSNLLVILMHLIPGNFKNKSYYQLIIKILYLIINSLLISTNFTDSKFFEFEGKRTTADIFSPYWLGHDFITLLPQILKDYWYILLIIFVFWYVLYRVYPRLRLEHITPTDLNRSRLIKQSLFSIFLIIGVFIGARGGLQFKPLRIIMATEYTDAHNIALVLNTPFTLMKTMGSKQFNDIKYFDDKQLDKLYSPVKQFSDSVPFRKLNVVVIILESFGKEYVGSLNGNKGYTPNLDSIIKKSLVFEHAYANGKESIEALPSIWAGIPSLLEKPFIISNFSGNQINSLASILRKESYQTAYFHGGKNGTMGFDFFAKLAGIEKYYGLNEYSDKKDYDGNWGIYDEPYLQYVANKLNEMPQPFFSSIFTLSSHHPYKIPAQHEGQFQKGKLVNLQSIRYADYSLGKFFETAHKMKWFANTIFVITADHTAQAMQPRYKTREGMYAVPLIFYMPADSNLVGKSQIITQQADILPSVLNYLNYPNKFVSFGNSVFDCNSNHFAINYISGVYQFIQEDYSLLFDGSKTIGLYQLSKDSLMNINLAKSKIEVAKSLENQLKSILQSYNNRMMTNKLIIKEKQAINK